MDESYCKVNLTKDCCFYENNLGLHIALFKDVKNINELLDKSIQEIATFIDASLVSFKIMISFSI